MEHPELVDRPSHQPRNRGKRPYPITETTRKRKRRSENPLQRSGDPHVDAKPLNTNIDRIIKRREQVECSRRYTNIFKGSPMPKRNALFISVILKILYLY